ncbi:MAG: type IV secretory system conjugative DNA transfer family protein [Candidatus Dormibacteria bacterium]
MLERLHRMGVGVQHAVDNAPRTAVHLALWSFWRLVAVAVAYLVLHAVLHSVRGRLWPERREALRIVPPAESAYRAESWLGFYRGLYAICPPWWKRMVRGVPWITLEFRASGGQVIAFCHCPTHLTGLTTATLHNALPGVQIDSVEEAEITLPDRPSARARLGLGREPLYPLGQPRLDPLVSALGALGAAHEAIVQVSLAPEPGWQKQAQHRLDRLSGHGRANAGASGAGFVLDILGGVFTEILDIFIPSGRTRDHRGEAAYPRAASQAPPSVRGNLPPSEKAFGHAWRTEVRLRVSAATRAEARQLAHAATGSFMLLEGPNGVRTRRVLFAKAFDRAMAARPRPGRAAMLLSPEELVSFFHLPVASARMAPARVRLAPMPRVHGGGNVLCRGDDGQLVRISLPDRRHHMALTGPTGSGKSTAEMILALQDVTEGLGCGVLDPKGDLVTDLLERIPREHWDRVVLLDPARQRRPVGINVLDCPDPSQREVVCDSLVTIFRKTYERFWGPRTEDVLRASLLTLLHKPGSTICEVPLLLLNDGVRAGLTRDLGDPVGLGAFWEEYERTSPAQRLQMVGPVMNKLRTLLVRPTVRNIFGQSRSTIDFKEVIDGRRILLVSLAKGSLGEEMSRLMGAFVMARIWQAAMSRIGMPMSNRPDFNLYLDEFQNYLHLPDSLGDILAEARAYHLNLTLAHQHLGQLTPAVRDAIDANARTRIAFQLGQEDARQMSRLFAPLTDHQLMSLERHQVAVRLCADGNVTAPFTGQMEPPSPSMGELHAAELARLSLSRYGRPVEEVEAEIEGRLRVAGLRGGYKEIA